MLRRWGSALIICLLAVVMLGAGDAASRYNKIGHEMMCSCVCGQILLECNHVSCPASPKMIAELHQQVSDGGTETSILNWFAAKYGATILAAPIRGGFDNVAWIAPLGVFFLATIGTAVLIRVWKLRSSQRRPLAMPRGDAGLDAMRERIRRETEY
jgi:cytochrome c-type biogenesis protein CcmH/NrfF